MVIVKENKKNPQLEGILSATAILNDFYSTTVKKEFEVFKKGAVARCGSFVNTIEIPLYRYALTPREVIYRDKSGKVKISVFGGARIMEDATSVQVIYQNDIITFYK